MGLMSHMGSKSVYEGPSVGRITFGPVKEKLFAVRLPHALIVKMKTVKLVTGVPMAQQIKRALAAYYKAKKR